MRSRAGARAGDTGPGGGSGGGDAGRDPVAGAVAYLLRSTQQRPQTEAELRAKLVLRDVAGDVAEAALDQVRAVGAVDDAAFARGWVEDRGRRRGFGRARLSQELRRRLVPEPLIADALAVLDDRDDLAAAEDLARARLRGMRPGLEPEAVARRLQGYLERRGHPPALARRVAIDVSGLGGTWD